MIKKFPDWLKVMVNDPNWKRQMQNHIYYSSNLRKRDQKAQQKKQEEGPGSDADEQELKDMDNVTPERIKLQIELLEKIGKINDFRARSYALRDFAI